MFVLMIKMVAWSLFFLKGMEKMNHSSITGWGKKRCNFYHSMRTIYHKGDKKTEFVQGGKKESDIPQRGQTKVSEMMESEEYMLTLFSPTVQVY